MPHGDRSRGSVKPASIDGVTGGAAGVAPSGGVAEFAADGAVGTAAGVVTCGAGFCAAGEGNGCAAGVAAAGAELTCDQAVVGNATASAAAQIHVKIAARSGVITLIAKLSLKATPSAQL
jgi:hypothetical protein